MRQTSVHTPTVVDGECMSGSSIKRTFMFLDCGSKPVDPVKPHHATQRGPVLPTTPLIALTLMPCCKFCLRSNLQTWLMWYIALFTKCMRGCTAVSELCHPRCRFASAEQHSWTDTDLLLKLASPLTWIELSKHETGRSIIRLLCFSCHLKCRLLTTIQNHRLLNSLSVIIRWTGKSHL